MTNTHCKCNICGKELKSLRSTYYGLHFELLCKDCRNECEEKYFKSIDKRYSIHPSHWYDEFGKVLSEMIAQEEKLEATKHNITEKLYVLDSTIHTLVLKKMSKDNKRCFTKCIKKFKRLGKQLCELEEYLRQRYFLEMLYDTDRNKLIIREFNTNEVLAMADMPDIRRW